MSLGNVPVGIELLVKLLVLPPLHRGHVKLHLGGLHLVKGVVAGSGRSLWALGDNWLPRVTLP